MEQNSDLNNVYASPESEIVNRSQEHESYYFTPSSIKLIVMTVGTMTMYWIYWFYKNWKALNYQKSLSTIPPLRALFAIFFVISLFTHISNDADEEKVENSLSPVLLGLLFIVIAVIGSLLDNMYPEDMLIFFVSYLAVVPMFYFNALARKVNIAKNPNVILNDKFTVLNIIFIIIFGGLTALLVLDSIFPEWLAE